MFSRFFGLHDPLHNKQPRYSKRRALPPLAVEVSLLENRVMLSAVTWSGAGDGSSWSDPKNWGGGAIPAAGSDVTINAAAGTTIHGPATAISIDSLTVTSGNLVLDGSNLTVTGATTVSSGQSLTINNGNTFTSGTIALDSGTLNLSGVLKGATVTETGTGNIALQGNTANLDGATINGNLNLTGGGALGLWHTVTVNGTISLGAANGSTAATLWLGDGTTNTAASLAGTATIVLGANGGNSIINNVVGGTATLGASVIVNGSSGYVQNNNNNSTLVVQGTVDASVSGGTIGVYSNTTGSLVQCTGTLTSANSGTLLLNGTFDAASSTIKVTGAVHLTGTTIQNGTLTTSGAGELVVTNGGALFSNLTINGNAVIDATAGVFITIHNTVTLDGSILLGATNGSNSSGLCLGDNSTSTAASLLGTATITFGGSGSNVIANNVVGGEATLGSGITVNGADGYLQNSNNGSTLLVQGTINASVSGGTINLNASDFGSNNLFQFTGTLTSTNGGTLALNGTIDAGSSTIKVTGVVTSNGATIQNGTVTTSGSGKLLVNTNGLGLTNLTVNGSAIIDDTAGGFVSVNGTVTLLGTILLGNTAGTTSSILWMGDGVTNTPASLLGTATITFGGSTNNLIRNNVVGGAVTLGSGITVNGANGTLVNYQSNDTLLIQGTVNASVSGGTISISSAGSFVSGSIVQTVGSLQATGGGSLSLYGDFTNTGTITSSGAGSLNFNGTLNLSGSTLSLASVLNVASGSSITDGTITCTGSGKLAIATGYEQYTTFDSLTVNGSLDQTQGGTLTLLHTVTVNGTISLGATNGSTSAALVLGDGSTNTAASLLGTATVVFGGSGYNEILNNVAGGTATLGANVIVNGTTGILANNNGNNVFLSQGTINASVSGGTITVNSYGNGTFQITGKLEATGGSLLLQYNLTMTGSITASGTGVVTLQGTMNLAASTVALTGSMTVSGGTITNGSMTVSGSLLIQYNGATLNNVTVTGNIDDATVGAYLTLLNTVTLNGTLSIGNAAGTTTGVVNLGDGSTATAATLDGTATVVFGGSTQNGVLSQVAGGIATLGAGVTVEGKNGNVNIEDNFGTTTVVILGTVNASVSGGTINIGDANNTFECTGTLTSASGATLNISGPINIAGKTVTLTAPVTLNGGNFNNGTIATSGTGKLMVTGAGGGLVNVTVNGNIDAATLGGAIEFQQTVTLNGTLSLGNTAGTNSATLYLGDGSTNTPAILNGNATIVFGGSNNYQNKVLNNVNGGMATLAATVTVEGDTGSLDNNNNTNGATTLVVLGTVDATVSGGIINIGDDFGSQFQCNGTLTSANGGFVGIGGPVSLAGGSLSITAPVLLGDDFSGVAGGVLRNGTVNITGTGKLVTLNAGLDDITVNGNIDEATYGSSLGVNHTVVLNGTLSLGNTAGTIGSTIYLGDSSTSTTAILAGNATVVFGGEGNGNNTIQAAAPGGKSIIGAGVTLDGKNGWVSNEGATDTLENLGTVDGNVSGGSITFGNVFDSGPFINRGILEGNVVTAGNETSAAAAPLNIVSTGTALLINGISDVLIGGTGLGTPTSKTFTVANDGDAPMIVQPVIVPTGFIVTSNFTANQTIAAGSSAQFTIELAANAVGIPSGTVTIPDNDTLAGDPFTFAINGSVLAVPHIVVTNGSTALTNGTSTVAFGNTTIGTPITQTITVTNTGGLPLIVQPLTLPTGFTVTSNFTANQSIAAGGSANLTIQFNATAAGTFSGVVTIGDNDTTASPFKFNVSATAVTIPTITANAPGGVYNGNHYSATATATGTGGVTVTGTSTFTYYTGSTVSGTGTTTAPSAAGTYTVVVSFTSSNSGYGNATSAPVIFTITKATPTVTALAAGGSYTGSAYSATVTATGVGSATVSGTTIFTYYAGSTVSGAGSTTGPTDVGTYTVVAAFTSTNSNYGNASSSAVTFTIKAAAPTVVVTDAGGTYTGSLLAATAKVTGVGGVTVSGTTTFTYYSGSTASGTGTTTAPTNAGTYTVVAEFTTANLNYGSASSSAVTFTIKAATPTVVVTDAGGTYTGSPFAATSTVTGIGGVTVSGTTTLTYSTGSTASGTGTTTAPSNAGTYTVVAAFTSTNSNYGSASSSAVTFTIKAAISTIVVTDAGGTYTGSPFAATAMATGIGSVTVSGTTIFTYYTGSTVSGTGTTTAPTNIGTYTVVAAFTSTNSNYGNATSSAVTFTIKAATPTVAVTEAGGSYTGSLFAATVKVTGVGGVTVSGTTTLTYYSGSTATGTGTTTAPTNIGTYTVVAAFTSTNSNYSNAMSSAVTFTIKTATPTFTLTDAGGTYTGSPFAATVKVTGIGGVTVSGTTTLTYYSGSTATGTGTTTAPTNAGTYTVVAAFTSTNSNYGNASSSAVTFTIKAATPTVTLTDAGGTYTGSAFGATAKVTGIGGVTVSGTTTFTYYSGSTATGTGTTTAPSNAGTYTVVAAFTSTNSNYGSASSSAVTFTIKTATPSVVAVEAGGTFTSSPFSATVKVTGIGGVTVSGTTIFTYYTGSTVSGTGTTTAPTNVGTYTVVAVFTSTNSNYGSASSSSVTFTIKTATPAVVVTDASGTYTGSPFSATVKVTGIGSATVSGTTIFTYYAGSTVSGTGTITAPTNIGTYTVVAAFTSTNSNYGGATSSAVTFTIKAATPTVAVTEAGGSYTGSPFAATVKVTGVGGVIVSGTTTLTYYSGSTASGTGTTTAPTNIGTYTVVAEFTSSNSNYSNASSSAVTLTIKTATPTFALTDAGGTYTGSPFAATVKVTGIGGVTVSGATTLTYYSGSTATGTGTTTAPTNAGTYTVVAAFTSTNSIYGNASSSAVTFTIKAATPTVAVTDAGGTYTGSAFAATAKVTGIGGVTVSGTTTYTYYSGSSATGTGTATAPTNAGTYTVVAAFTSTNSNYGNASSSAVIFTIKAATQKVQISDWGGLYSGNPDAALATVTGVGGVTVSGTTTYTYFSGTSASGTGTTTAPTNVGTYTVVAAFTSTNSNYGNASSSPLTFEIEPTIPTIAITGTPLAPVVTVTGSNGAVVSGTTTIEYYTGSSATGTGSTTPPSAAGTYTVVIMFTSKNSDFSNASSAPVTFTIA